VVAGLVLPLFSSAAEHRAVGYWVLNREEVEKSIQAEIRSLQAIDPAEAKRFADSWEQRKRTVVTEFKLTMNLDGVFRLSTLPTFRGAEGEVEVSGRWKANGDLINLHAPRQTMAVEYKPASGSDQERLVFYADGNPHQPQDGVVLLTMTRIAFPNANENPFNTWLRSNPRALNFVVWLIPILIPVLLGGIVIWFLFRLVWRFRHRRK
jgi:hypothetical protein